MFKPKFRFTHDEVRIIVMALVELKNQLIAEKNETREYVCPVSSAMNHPLSVRTAMIY